MARRKLLKNQDRQKLFNVPTDEDSLIRHYSLSHADRLEISVRRGEHNQLGFAVQLCLMRYPGRTLLANETPPKAMVHYIAEQLNIAPKKFDLYANREETRREHIIYLLSYLGMRSATAQDRRACLLSAIEIAATTDKGVSIANTIITTFREIRVLLPAADTVERIGLAARAIARQQAQVLLTSDLSPLQLQSLDDLLTVDLVIGQTRFHWLRSAPDAPGASNLVAVIERLSYVRSFGIDPLLQERIHSGRWDQIIREGDATPAWLAVDFNASRRHATIVAQIIKLGQRLTDDAISMFIKLMGRLFSQANNRKKKRHADARKETTTALRLFIDTISALQVANENDEDAIETINRDVGWHRLLQVKPTLEAMVQNGDLDPLSVAAEQYASVRKYAALFLNTFAFRSARRHDSLLTAIEALKSL